MSGYDFTSRNSRVLSVTTAESRAGQQDTFLHLRGVDSHEHLWIPYPQGVAAAGQRLKGNGTHLNSASSVALGVPFARANVDWSLGPNTPSISIAALSQASATTANTSLLRPKAGTRPRIPLGDDARPSVTVEFALVPRTVSPNDASFNRLEWNSATTWMLGWRLV